MKNLTREQLYNLVWTKPTRDIAKELGVSDVWVGKVCKAANIPKPSPGYWQKIAAGKVMRRVTLPPQLPLQAKDMFVLCGTDRYGDRTVARTEPTCDDGPMPPPPDPPVFVETIEEVQSRAKTLVASLKLNESLAKVHPMTQRLLDGDERRAVKNASFTLIDWYPPKYRHPSGKELLTALNRLFWAWTTLGAEVLVQGQINQSISLNILGERMPLGLLDYGWTGNSFEPRFKSGARFGLYWEDVRDTHRWFPKSARGYKEYDHFQPESLKAILVDSIVRTESVIREGRQWTYKWKLEHWEDDVKKREERHQEAIRRHEEAVQRLIQKRQELIDDALDRINRSDRLRSLVQVFDQKIESMNEAVNGYDKWRCWALDQAMAIDPKTMSVEHIGQWIGEFRLLE